LTFNASMNDLTPGNECENSKSSGPSPPDRAQSANNPLHEDIIRATTLAFPLSLASSVSADRSSRSGATGSNTFVRSDSTIPSADGPRRGGSG
jgi:hypothetical protein